MGSRTNGFSDFPMPADTGLLYNHEQYLKYLQDYAQHFNLPHIWLGTRVIKLDKAPDYGSTGRWKVTYKKKGNPEESDVFDCVIVASGYYRTPTYPDIEGMDQFKGVQLHTLDYRDPKPFQGKTVVVIGWL